MAVSTSTRQVWSDDSAQCPSCLYFDCAQAQYPASEYPTIARHLARRRERHIADGDCLVAPDGK